MNKATKTFLSESDNTSLKWLLEDPSFKIHIDSWSVNFNHLILFSLYHKPIALTVLQIFSLVPNQGFFFSNFKLRLNF